MSGILPVCLRNNLSRNNLSENILPYGDRQVGQDFADFMKFMQTTFASILLLISLFVLECFI